MTFFTLKKLLNKIKPWFEDIIPSTRLTNDASGRRWFAKQLEYTDTFKLSDLKEITDRKNLNDTFLSRYRNEDPKSRQGISAVKVEISALYGFTKCFVQRYKGRMHFYRDDLSQKGDRNMIAVGKSAAAFNELSKNLS